MKTILNIILGILSVLSKAAEIYTRNQDKKAGRNEEKLDNLDIVNERKSIAKRIIDGVRNKSKGDK